MDKAQEVRRNGKERKMEWMADGVLAALPFVITVIVALGFSLEARDALVGVAPPVGAPARPREALPTTVVMEPVVEAA